MKGKIQIVKTGYIVKPLHIQKGATCFVHHLRTDMGPKKAEKGASLMAKRAKYRQYVAQEMRGHSLLLQYSS